LFGSTKKMNQGTRLHEAGGSQQSHHGNAAKRLGKV
jgi:hypothetical protein